MIQNKPENRPTELLCPITGSRLIYSHTEELVMDPDSFYYAESDPSIKYSRHPFSWNVFRLIDHYSMDSRAIRYFKLEEDNTWSEYIRVEGLSNLVHIDTPKSEIEEAVQKEAEEKARRKADYDDRVASGEIVPFPSSAIKINARTFSHDEVKVQPMGPPQGILLYIDIEHKDQK